MSVEAKKDEKDVVHPERKPLIIGVEVTQGESGIPLKGWESVKGALETFASGRLRGSRLTEEHQIKAVGESHGGFAQAFYIVAAPHMQDRGGSFVEGMLNEAKPVVDSRGRWSRHYDYDGMSSFFKTTVEINQAEKPDGYVLKLNAAYVGNQVEEGLAEALEAERGLSWKNVSVEFEPEGGNFRIDFDQVAEKLKPVAKELGRKKVEGTKIAQHLMKTDKWGESEGPFVLGTKNGVEVTVGLGRVGRRFEYTQGERPEDRYYLEGATITGPLDTDYSDETKIVPPSVSIFVLPESKEKYNRLPAVKPETKSLLHNLTDKIAEGFRR